MALGSIGKYEKLDVLGHGVSGIVYLAWDTMLGRHVALKEISLQGADEARFMEEARVLDRLRHPNIVQVHNVDKIDGHLLIDMEYVKGTNLHEYMRRHGRLPVRQTLTTAIQICDALECAHSNNTVHRDIKPANILISEGGIAKIGDFGLAEILGSGSYAGGAGTYAYMAPEDFEEEEKSDRRSDIWAVGVTLYEMLTGSRPFQAVKSKDPFSWKRTIQEDEPVPVTDFDSSLPPQLRQVFSLALAKNKNERYQYAQDMRDDLAWILASIGGEVSLELRTRPSVREVAAREYVVVTSRPEELDFGRVRSGDLRKQVLSLHVGGHGRTEGRLVSQPAWAVVSPAAFERRRQTLLVTADTESIWQPGTYTDQLHFEVDGESFLVPVRMEVLPARRQFYEVAWWYLPLMAFTLLPFIVRSVNGGEADPTALVTSGLLAVMLFIISVCADMGILEKLAPAAIFATGTGAVIGMFLKAVDGGCIKPEEIFPVAIAGSLLSLLIALQLLTASKWRVWSVILVLCSICAAFVLAR